MWSGPFNHIDSKKNFFSILRLTFQVLTILVHKTDTTRESPLTLVACFSHDGQITIKIIKYFATQEPLCSMPYAEYIKKIIEVSDLLGSDDCRGLHKNDRDQEVRLNCRFVDASFSIRKLVSLILIVHLKEGFNFHEGKKKCVGF